jgi:anaerobic ribonucleoside-triphosphate reductase activating protein
VDQTLRVHHLLESSRANGPGLRAVLWLQGCTLGCPECFNPATHSRSGGELIGLDALAERLETLAADSSALEGLTISGGEPLQQRPALGRLLRRLRGSTRLSVVLFSGFAWEEIVAMQGSEQVLEHVDVLIAGRYDHARRVAHGLIGSANKTIHFLTDRYGPADFESLPDAELILDTDGSVVLTGIDPVRW